MTYPNYLNSQSELCSSSAVQNNNLTVKFEQTDFDNTILIKTNKDKLNTILKKYGLENQFDIIDYITNEEVSDDYLKSLKDSELELIKKSLEKAFEEFRDTKTKKIDFTKAIEKAQYYFILSKNGSDINNNERNEKPSNINSILKAQLGDNIDLETLSEQEKQNAIKNYFETKLNEYKKQGKSNPEEELKKDYRELLLVLSDKDKKYVLTVATEIIKDATVVEDFFKSFKDKELAIKAADSIEFKDFEAADPKIQEILVANMSVGGTELLVSTLEEKAKAYYIEHKEVLDRVFKVEDDSTLSREELNIKNEFKRLNNMAVTIQRGILNSNNKNNEEKEQLTQRIFSIFTDTPFQDTFIKQLAESLSKSELAGKYKDLLDKATDNKFTEKLKDINEKSAIDTETGMLKIVPAETIAQSREKIQELSQTITDTSSAPQILIADTNEDITEQQHETDIIDYKLLTGNGNITALKDVFTGKIKISDYLEKTAIKQYKLMDAAIQGDMLLNASDKFFNDLVRNTKTSTLENLLAIGWKGKSFDATKKVKDEAEERKDDVA